MLKKGNNKIPLSDEIIQSNTKNECLASILAIKKFRPRRDAIKKHLNMAVVHEGP